MKGAFTLVVLLALGGGGYLAAAHLSGGAFYDFGLGLGGERGYLRGVAMSFLEDIKFKDFEKAASYHAPDVQDTVDIPFLIERVFQLKPEALEILDTEVVMAELDSTGNRGRVKTRIKAKDLTREKIRTQELMLFFHREEANAPWFMELESSLRQLKGEKGKTH